MDSYAAREAVKKLRIILIFGIALICLSACGRKSQAEQLAALDSAYQSGVLTKEEYDAKKAALMGPAPPVPAAPAPAATVITPAAPAPEPARSKGCEDAESQPPKTGRQSRFYPLPEARVKRAARAALATLNFTIHKDSGEEIETDKRAGGEREILHFEATLQDGRRGTRVTAETKKGLIGRVAQKSWTASILAQTACNLR